MKQQLTHIDMAQDAGAIIQQIIKIRKKLTFYIEVKHILRERRDFDFLVDPEQYLINRCDAYSKIKQIEIEKSSEIHMLDSTASSINKSVNNLKTITSKD